MNIDDLKMANARVVISKPKEHIKMIKEFVEKIYNDNNLIFDEKELNSEIRKHIYNFLVYLSGSYDGNSNEEIKSIGEILDIKNINGIMPQNIRTILMQREDFLNYVPQYLQKIRNFINSRENILVIIDSIITLGINFASNDEKLCEEEAKALSNYKNIIIKRICGYENHTNGEMSKILMKGSKIINGKNNNKQNDKQIIKETLEDIDNLIGLENVKQELNTLINLSKINRIREDKGLPVVPVSNHIVFAGNPGTGKTTVARILSKIYASIGVLSKGHLVEVDRSGLIGEYIGQTAQKTKDVIRSAMGGILFIDEAYSLCEGGQEDYGKEAVSVLLKEMEDNRNDIVVIVAGYTDKMKDFMEMNPGLKSRFNKYIIFEDYSDEELIEILKFKLNENKYKMENGVDKKIIEYLRNVEKEKFANGRGIRNLFEKMIEQQANRLVRDINISVEELQTLTLEDFQGAVKQIKYEV